LTAIGFRCQVSGVRCQVSGVRFQVSGFSPAAGQTNGRSNRKRIFEKANIEYRIMNVESSCGGQVSKECILPVVSFCRTVYFIKKLSYLSGRSSKSEAPSLKRFHPSTLVRRRRIQYSIFCGSAGFRSRLQRDSLLNFHVEHQEEVKQKISIFFRQHSTGPIRAGSLKIQLTRVNHCNLRF